MAIQGSITAEAWNKLSPVNSESMLRALPVIGFYESILHIPWVNCRRQEERAILISRLLLRMRRLYVAGIRLDLL